MPVNSMAVDNPSIGQNGDDLVFGHAHPYGTGIAASSPSAFFGIRRC
jgi:hypothetical protein